MIVMQSALSLAQHTKRSTKKTNHNGTEGNQVFGAKTKWKQEPKETEAEYKSKSATKGDVNNDVVDDNRRNESKIAYFVGNYSRRIL